MLINKIKASTVIFLTLLSSAHVYANADIAHDFYCSNSSMPISEIMAAYGNNVIAPVQEIITVSHRTTKNKILISTFVVCCSILYFYGVVKALIEINDERQAANKQKEDAANINADLEEIKNNLKKDIKAYLQDFSATLENIKNDVENIKKDVKAQYKDSLKEEYRYNDKFIIYPKNHDNDVTYKKYIHANAISQNLADRAEHQLYEAKLDEYKNSDAYMQEEKLDKIQNSIINAFKSILDAFDRDSSYPSLYAEEEDKDIINTCESILQKELNNMLEALEQYCVKENAGEVSNKNTICVLLQNVKKQHVISSIITADYKHIINIIQTDKYKSNELISQLAKQAEIVVRMLDEHVVSLLGAIEPNVRHYIHTHVIEELKSIDDNMTHEDKAAIYFDINEILHIKIREVIMNKMHDPSFKDIE